MVKTPLTYSPLICFNAQWTADNATRSIVPEDYVGEKELESGKYTYVILPLTGADDYRIDLQAD